MSRPLRIALLLAFACASSCVDVREEARWCAEGRTDSCRIACDRGDDDACLAGGEQLFGAPCELELDPACLTGRKLPPAADAAHDGGPADADLALTMFGRACAHGVMKACHAAARAADDGNSLAPLPWLERICRDGSESSCRDVAATRLGAEVAPARVAYATFCRANAAAPVVTGELPGAHDERACVTAWTERHVAATRASLACDAGDARACADLGTSIVDALQEGPLSRSLCAEVMAPGVSPLANGLACERAGRAFARACSLRGLGEPPAQHLRSCPSWLANLDRRRGRAQHLDAPRDGVTLTVSAAPGTPESIAAAVQRLAPEFLRCPIVGDARAAPPGSRSASRFVVDRTGRPAWVVSAQRGTAPGGVNGVCLDNVLDDANLGLLGDGRTYFEVELVFARR